MDSTQQMLRKIINHQSVIKSELLSRIGDVDKRMGGLSDKIDKLDLKIDGVEKRLTDRIDKIGLQVASLEDDTPTIEDFNNLSGRVDNLQQNFLSS